MRSRVDSLLASLETWWLAPRPLHALIGARILFGSVLFWAYALRITAFQDLFGPRGIGGSALAGKVPALPAFHPGLLPALDLLRQIPDERVVTVLFALLLASLAAFTIGLATRVAGVVALALHLLFWARNPIGFGGWASFVIAPLLYVVLAPVGRHLSADAWMRRRRGLASASWFASGWRLRLLQIHVCAMYATSGWSRLDKPTWLAGDTVRIALTSAVFSRAAIDWSSIAWLLAVATWASLVLEVFAPVLLWVPRVRKPWALGLVGMHAALPLLVHDEIWAWSGVMIGGLLAFLFSDDAPTTKG